MASVASEGSGCRSRGGVLWREGAWLKDALLGASPLVGPHGSRGITGLGDVNAAGGALPGCAVSGACK